MLLKRLNLKRYFDEPDVPTSKIFDCIWRKKNGKGSMAIYSCGWRYTLMRHVPVGKYSSLLVFPSLIGRFNQLKYNYFLSRSGIIFKRVSLSSFLLSFFRFLLKCTKVKHSEESQMSHEIWLLVSVCASIKQTF